MSVKWIVAPVFLLALVFSTETAASSEDYWGRVAQSLAGSSQLRDRALAAQLSGFDSYAAKLIADGASATASPASTEPVRTVAAADLLPQLARSEDVLALSLALQHGQGIGNKAQVEAAAWRWHMLEPDNLAPLLWLDLPIDELLVSARKARRYDSHAYDQIRFMIQAFEHVPLRPEEAAAVREEGMDRPDVHAMVSAFAIWAAYGLPAFQDLSKVCAGEALRLDAIRLADCRHVGQVLVAESDVHVAQGIGIGLMQRTASSPAEHAEAAALRRTLDWQLQQRYGKQTGRAQLRDEVVVMLRLLRDPAMSTERQLSEAMLREKGVAVVPPAEWQSPAGN